jgi:hypothetical protein
MLMITMRNNVLGIFVVALLLVCAVAAFGQEKIEISTDPPPANIDFPVLRKVGSAKVLKWTSKNQLISESAFFGVKLSQDEGINIKARFVTVGKSVLRPSAIDLNIYPGSTDRKYVDDRTFKIISDGKVSLSTTSKFQYANTDGHWIGAALKVSIPYDDFVKISQAKAVSIKVGPTLFTLNDAGQQALRDILKTVE